ncbi:E3 ubiquitin-protein ligase RNF4 [Populus alba x Populus x berolinensis]|nr:E3 ubiquitin-protein ligase RNF4 [Populus alba x Populus x berolinensis]
MSTQTQGVKSPPLRGYRRRKTVLDLNAPPTEGRGDEGTSSRNEPQGVQASQQGQSLPTPTIDVDVFDDDVIESSSTAFAEAKNNARRARGRAVVVDVESGQTSRLSHNNLNKRRRGPPNQTIINCDLYINLEGGSSSSSRSMCFTLLPEGECADPAAKGANLQLSNLLVSIG